MARFAVGLPLSGLVWDLLADLEPIVQSAKERQPHMVEVLDSAGTFQAQGIESARMGSAKRKHPPHRITLTLKGYAGPANVPQERREYTVSVWASGLTQKTGATVNGHTTGGGAHAASYAEDLLGEIDGQVRAFLKHHYIPADLVDLDPRQPDPPAADAAPQRTPARGLGGLLQIIAHQPLAATIVGSTIAGVLAAIIIALLI